MFRKQPSKPQNRIDSLIGVGTRIEGNINFSGGLRVDGEVIGNVTAVSDEPSTLVLSEKARIEGEISVSHLVVNGEITGPVYVAEFLELQSRSRVKGDVHYNNLEMHLGAVVEGHLVHQSGESESKTVELKLATSKPTG
ncbi:MAG TPA: polymer-forming cytoskeletal protein [Burkholderiales bacterium]|nr:polymer-forming cytoskeletal protein [Burkholderiales bacterium]HYA47907.1 polymer-forming cytoskeletal protein [Burkholderiales bacterium]